MSERTTLPFRVQPPGWIDEFRAFIMRGNVIDLAVGIIIGVAFTAVVNSLVKDIFTPDHRPGNRRHRLHKPICYPERPIGANPCRRAEGRRSDPEHRPLPQRPDPVPDRQLCDLLADQGADASARARGGGAGGAAEDRGAARGDP